MDTTYLKTFQRVIETGSFSNAARKLGYAQSTVTGHIQVLERLMGRRLVDRRPHGAVPTEAGARLLRHAEALLRQEEELMWAVRGRGHRSTTLRLAASESLSSYRLPPALASLAREERSVRINVTTAGTAASLAALRRGEVDAALVVEHVLTADDLVVTKLGDEPVRVFATRAGRGDADGEKAPPVHLLLERGCCYSDELSDQLAVGGTPDARMIRMNSLEAAKRCCLAGMGLAVLPEVAVREEVARGELRVAEGVAVRPAVAYLVHHPDASEGTMARVAARLAALWQHPADRDDLG